MSTNNTGIALLGKEHAAIETVELNIDLVRRYLAPTASDGEIYSFLQIAKSQGLNPFLREIYLVKFDPKTPASFVVSKDAFFKRADCLAEFDGLKAGVIVRNKDEAITYREGAFLDRGETLLGGWAEVYRKDRKIPFRSEVSLKEYSRGTRSWRDMAATMVRKVSVVQALREAFPNAFGALYSPEELPGEPSSLPSEAVDISHEKEQPEIEAATIDIPNQLEQDIKVTADGEVITDEEPEEEDPGRLASKDQLVVINDLLMTLGHTKRPRKIWFVKNHFGFDAMALTTGQAEQVIAGLKKMIVEREGGHDED